jgi:hypothetical protein
MSAPKRRLLVHRSVDGDTANDDGTKRHKSENMFEHSSSPSLMQGSTATLTRYYRSFSWRNQVRKHIVEARSAVLIAFIVRRSPALCLFPAFP